MANKGNIVIRDAYIFPGSFRNFGGAPDKFHPEGGARKFVVSLSEGDITYNGKSIKDADILRADGWGIRRLNPRDEEDEPTDILNVKVKFDKIPPKIVQITSKGTTALDGDSVKTLDWAEIKKADVSISPYEWEPGRISAYLKTLYVTLEEDEFENDYDFDFNPCEDEDVPF